jgi:hypothetical protein
MMYPRARLGDAPLERHERQQADQAQGEEGEYPGVDEAASLPHGERQRQGQQSDEQERRPSQVEALPLAAFVSRDEAQRQQSAKETHRHSRQEYPLPAEGVHQEAAQRRTDHHAAGEDGAGDADGPPPLEQGRRR